MSFWYIFPSKSAKNVFPREKKRKSLRENQMSRSQKIRIYQQQQEQGQEEAAEGENEERATTTTDKEMRRKIIEILPEMNLGLFCVSARAATGIPQLATGPQKWVLQIRKTLLTICYSSDW